MIFSEISVPFVLQENECNVPILQFFIVSVTAIAFDAFQRRLQSAVLIELQREIAPCTRSECHWAYPIDSMNIDWLRLCSRYVAVFHNCSCCIVGQCLNPRRQNARCQSNENWNGYWTIVSIQKWLMSFTSKRDSLPLPIQTNKCLRGFKHFCS